MVLRVGQTATGCHLTNSALTELSKGIPPERSAYDVLVRPFVLAGIDSRRSDSSWICTGKYGVPKPGRDSGGEPWHACECSWVLKCLEPYFHFSRSAQNGTDKVWSWSSRSSSSWMHRRCQSLEEGPLYSRLSWQTFVLVSSDELVSGICWSSWVISYL